MKEIYAYHVVTEKPMKIGQHIIFDESHRSGVYERVMEKLSAVHDIYEHPQKYDTKSLEHHTKVALRELSLEEVRQKEYPHLPSRMSCLYVSESAKEAEQWARLFADLGREVFSIVKLKCCGRIFEGNANNCFDATLSKEENLKLAKQYWENLPNIKNEPPIKEILIDGDIEVIEIIKEYI